MIKDKFSPSVQELLSNDEWMILEEEYKPEENLVYESLFCLSNGYLGTRGSHEEGTKKSIPCTYINGVFDKSETFMRELANMPNWLGLRLYVEKELIGIENCSIIEYTRALDMKHALLAKHVVLLDKNGKKTRIESVRMVSRGNVHRMGIQVFVTPLNYEGIIEVENIVDGSVINFCDAPRFKVKHTYLTANQQIKEDGCYVEVATRDRHLHVGVGSRMEVLSGGKDIMTNRQFHAFGETAVEFGDFHTNEGETIELVKYVSIYTQREKETAEICENVEEELKGFKKTGFLGELKAHKMVYQKMWEEADVKIKGDDELNRGVRFNIFHLMSTGNESDDRVNVGAKLLHGEEYGGHAFWDTELFMLPFFSFVFPKTAKNLESYRYHLLDAARDNAKKNGYKGAQYPWESADDGTEQCPDWTIEPDGSCYRCYVAVYEHHVTAAVAYGIYNYVKITKDYEFLYNQGLEILIETARFWASRCEYNQELDRYEIRQVTGPDEWHEPVDNNLYTNYLAKWNLGYVLGLVEELKEKETKAYDTLAAKQDAPASRHTCHELNISEEEYSSWETCRKKMYLPRQEGTDLLEQFEGYFKLKEVLIEEYDENDWPKRPEALKTSKKQETQIIKQADVVMLMHLMGEEFDEKTQKLNYDYYEKRTLHGSSLSPSIYAIMGLKVGDGSKAYRYLRRAALIDLVDLQKNTREGIHAANAGGVWQTVVFGFAGVSVLHDGTLKINPHLPKEWEGLAFRLHYGGAWLDIVIGADNEVKVTLLKGESISLMIKEEIKVINGGNE